MKKSTLLDITLPIFCFAVSVNAHNFSSPAEQTIYESNKHVIDSMLEKRIPEGLVKISHFYKVPANSHNKLKHYVEQRELQLICQDYLFADSLVQRVINKIKIEQCYTDSINTILIPVKGNNISGENLSYALRHREMLGLDSIQYDHIMKTAVEMARHIKADYRTEVWNEEMEILKTTLDNNQLQSFFRSKNARKVTDEFKKIYDKLIDAGLTEHIDSTKYVPDAINYLFNRQMLKDLYRSNSAAQKIYLSELERNKPEIISMYDGLIYKEKYRREEQGKAEDNDFIW